MKSSKRTEGTIRPIRTDMNRLAWHRRTIRVTTSRHGFGIDLAAVVVEG